jgi:hypothetical protein
MSSETKFTCDFCGGLIVKATKGGARGYCQIRDTEYREWSADPYVNLYGRHICEACVESLVTSKAYNN